MTSENECYVAVDGGGNVIRNRVLTHEEHYEMNFIAIGTHEALTVVKDRFTHPNYPISSDEALSRAQLYAEYAHAADGTAQQEIVRKLRMARP